VVIAPPPARAHHAGPAGTSLGAGDVAYIEIAQLKKTVEQLDQPVGDGVIEDGAA
jgi:hypothetical protein